LSTNHFRRLLVLFAIVGFIYWIASGVFHNLKLHELVVRVPFNRELSIFLTERLSKVDALRYTTRESSQVFDRVIYVMGGSQKSLKYRFKTAADLYHLGLCNRILIPSRQGITQYNPSLSRNLTNNEWAMNKLMELGVKKEDIELVGLKKGYFGTFTEARSISDIVSQRGYKNLILVTSLHHTMRTWLSFSEFLKDKGITIYIYASNDCIELHNLILEYFKLIIYKDLILPISFVQI
jgi:uncharacterized SAM-binding protein YcdF (DUF218 family)